MSPPSLSQSPLLRSLKGPTGSSRNPRGSVEQPGGSPSPFSASMRRSVGEPEQSLFSPCAQLGVRQGSDAERSSAASSGTGGRVSSGSGGRSRYQMRRTSMVGNSRASLDLLPFSRWGRRNTASTSSRNNSQSGARSEGAAGSDGTGAVVSAARAMIAALSGSGSGAASQPSPIQAGPAVAAQCYKITPLDTPSSTTVSADGILATTPESITYIKYTNLDPVEERASLEEVGWGLS